MAVCAYETFIEKRHVSETILFKFAHIMKLVFRLSDGQQRANKLWTPAFSSIVSNTSTIVGYLTGLLQLVQCAVQCASSLSLLRPCTLIRCQIRNNFFFNFINCLMVNFLIKKKLQHWFVCSKKFLSVTNFYRIYSHWCMPWLRNKSM